MSWAGIGKLTQESVTVLDDRCYFMETVTGAHWRVVFTGFEGSMTGNVELEKFRLWRGHCRTFAATSHLFPNPAHQGEEVILTSESRFSRLQFGASMAQKWMTFLCKVQTTPCPQPISSQEFTWLKPVPFWVEKSFDS